MYSENQACGASGCGPASERNFRHFQHRPHFGGYRRPKFNVPLNIVDKEDRFEVHVFALGFPKENVKISVSDDLLFISGSKEVAKENEPVFTRQEFPIKNFERTLVLNGQVDTENISATQQDGVLVISLPKTAEAQVKERNISVQ